MSALSYFNEPAPLAWDVAAAIFGADGVGGLYDPSALDTLFQDANGTTPAVPGSPVGLVLDKSGNSRNLSQPTTAARPILARMPKTGRRNLLTWTGNLKQPSGIRPWDGRGVTIVDGGDHSKIVENATSGAHYVVYESFWPGHGLDVEWSVEAKAVERQWIFLRHHNNTALIAAGKGAFFNVSTGEIGAVASGISASIEATTDGFYRCSIGAASPLTGTPPTSGGPMVSTALANGSVNTDAPNYTGDGTSGVLLRNAQFSIGEPTPYQRVTNAYDVTEEGVPSVYSLVYDLADDALTTTLPQAINGDILIAGTKGSIIEPVNYAAGSTFTIGPDTYTGGTPGILRAIGNVVGVVLIDRTLTQTERDVLIEHYKGKGAKGLLVEGPELVTNGDFSDGLIGWNDSAVTSSGGSVTNDSGAALITRGSSRAEFYQTITTVAGRSYKFSGTVLEKTGTANWWIGSTRNNASALNGSGVSVGTFNGIFTANSTMTYLTMGADGSSGQTVKIDNVSVRELRAEEDWA